MHDDDIDVSVRVDEIMCTFQLMHIRSVLHDCDKII